MKTQKFYLVILAVAILGLSNLFAQTKVETEYVLSGNHIKNLINGINSENPGLRRSAVYLAGKYKIVEAAEVLLTALEKETDPSTKILIALALYNINEPAAMQAVYQLSLNEENPRVKRMFMNIYSEYQKSYAVQYGK